MITIVILLYNILYNLNCTCDYSIFSHIVTINKFTLFDTFFTIITKNQVFACIYESLPMMVPTDVLADAS